MGESESGGLLRLEAVADPAHGHDVLGIGRLELDLLAQALHMGVEGAAVTAFAITPDPVHALATGHHVSRLGDEQRQEVELLAGQLDGPAAYGHLAQ